MDLGEPVVEDVDDHDGDVVVAALEMATDSRSLSATMLERPSEQITTRSPAVTSSRKWSAYMSGSEPSARVMIERDGCVRASSAVISPASTSSST